LQVVRPVDPRIHFALNCGAASCPAIKLYSTDTLEEGLAAAAEAFCASEVVIEPTNRKVGQIVCIPVGLAAAVRSTSAQLGHAPNSILTILAT
jgi:hypothetical protein